MSIVFIQLSVVDYVRSSSDDFVALKLSGTTGAHLLATNSNHHYVKCIDIYPKSESDLLLAIGQANGRVTLSTFGPSIYDTQGLTGKDLGENEIQNLKITLLKAN